MAKTKSKPLNIDSIYGPKNDLIDFDYEDMALQEIRKTYPEARHSCFSGRYITGSDYLENRAFLDRAGTKIKGLWIPMVMELTEEEFVKLLINEAMERLKNNDFSRFSER